ncbi:hypothetical protein P168DRAFT_305598 [Aspergillus campestris IBT 28561]|uniref:Uncharacterized protein n=1 Tax=Aspergillus campestris (strain IBT 28561) TaxID=1392248 RepID=A0A2I1D098_ASPC2|nr:uncharacterized protein P168DRAFT_305598 [Aspergillus campestris IBT 28561]PKY03297.1 hypothetical protein P168DRAFT_305598 [Aspergillus campestris IBT 28561]
MAKQLKYLELVEQMKGRQTINGYDVLVSYSQEKINQLLQARSESLTSILGLGPLDVDGKITGVGPVHLSVSMKLDHPRLQFVDEYGNITLAFRILSGSITNKDTKNTDYLTDDLVLSFNTTLVNVTGTVEGDFANPGAKTAPVNEPVILNPDQKNVSQGVCVTFEKSSLDITSTTGQDRLDLAVVKSGLQKYFKEHAELKYYVAGVSNQYQPESGSHLLRPHAFSFATIKGNTEAETSALCMRIHVAQGTGGSDDSAWTPFGADGLLPMPRGSDCSMIIKSDVFVDQLILPSLRNGFGALENKTKPGEGGLACIGNMTAGFVEVPAVDNGDGKVDGGLGYYKVQLAGFHFSPGVPKTTITLGGDINATSNEIQFTSSTQEVSWKDEIGTEKGSVKGSGTVDLQFSWGAKGSWKDKSNSDHPNMLGFDWVGDGNWNIHLPKVDERSWLERAWKGRGSVPAEYKNLQVPSPNVNLEVKTLDYFLTTNLLYPGKHIFKADNPSSDSTDKGLAFPHDLILTGQILTS